MNTLTIKGMHCDACKKLITMELEDAGLNQHVASIELGNNNVGRLCLRDGTESEVLNNIKKVLNGMKDYSIE